MIKPKSCSDPEKFIQLWIHEASWVFHDRLINQEDWDFFKENVVNILEFKFREKWTLDDIFNKQPIIFSNLMRLGADEELYEQINDMPKLTKQL